MKIKYLKNAPQGNAGEVHEVEDGAALVLIQLGYAEKHIEAVKQTAKPQKKGS